MRAMSSLVHGEPSRDMAVQDGVRAVGSRPNDDLGLGQRRFARPDCPPFFHNAAQGQVALGAHLQIEIHEPVAVTFSPFLYSVRCLLVQR